MKIKKLTDVLLRLCVGTVFAWGAVCGILNKIYYNPPYGEIFLQIFIIMFAFYIVFYNKYTVITVSVLAGVLLLTFLYNPIAAEIVQNIIEFANRIVLYISGYEPYLPIYQTVVTAMLCAAVSVFTFVFTSFQIGFFAVAVFAAIEYGILFVSGGFVNGLPFTACMSGVLILLAKYLHTSGKFKMRPVGIGVAAIVVVCLGVSQLLPIPEKGFANAAVNAVIYEPFKAANKFISSLFAPKYFSLSSTGYLRNDRILGGDVYLTDDVVMEVTTNKVGALYLAGIVMDKYTGSSWENTLTDDNECSFNDPNYELIERMFSNLMISLMTGEFEAFAMAMENSALFKYSMHADRCEFIEGGTLTVQMQQHLYNMNEAEINVLNGRTFTVFKPEIVVGIEKDTNPLPLIKDDAGNLNAEKLLAKNSPYTVYYRGDPLSMQDIKYLSRQGIFTEMYEEIQDLHTKYDFSKYQISALLDESLDEDKYNMHMIKMYPAEEDYFDHEISVNYEDFLADVLIPRAELIRKHYTLLPASIPKRVVDLAIQITMPDDNDYMKAATISRFLKNYPYTLTPGDTPEDRDFVDYFLFDLQKGYCTYFASAFVVMCRAVGVPARYVEGYVTPSKLNEQGMYVVTNKHGHAWGEVYLEGYGWQRFDPTPAENSEGRVRVLPAAENYPLFEEETGDIMTINVYSDVLNIFDETVTEEALNTFNPILFNVNTDEPEQDLAGIFTVNLTIALTLIIAAFVLYIAARYVFARIAVSRIKHKPANEAAVAYYKIILKYLRFFGYNKTQYETAHQFAERVDVVPMGEVADMVSAACYGNAQVDAQRIDTIRSIINELENKIGRFRYIIYYTKTFLTASR
ncbi:MAG: transglutaminase-like domain-containing protein [Oscillospiraceae bacterium]|nr:transglutaminase-like domain-containing protein [Oscillospiraceae bacterium]